MNKIDLLFICDITGSMGSFIEDAKKRMRDILKELSEEFKVDTKIGLSLYRDHPSQGDPFVTVTFDLMSIEDIQSRIDLISVDGGGDWPEAVLCGVKEGITSMTWREKSRRIAFLIGDAPPHGMNDDDCCTCGITWGEVVHIAEENSVPIYSITLNADGKVLSSFRTLSTFTGGLVLKGSNALDAVLKTLQSELGEMNLGVQVLDMLSKDITPEEICKMLSIDRERVSELETKQAIL